MKSVPAIIDVFDDWDEWRMVIIYDFHQEEPEVCTEMEFFNRMKRLTWYIGMLIGESGQLSTILGGMWVCENVSLCLLWKLRKAF